jgi:hypothetical protein
MRTITTVKAETTNLSFLPKHYIDLSGESV